MFSRRLFATALLALAGTVGASLPASAQNLALNKMVTPTEMAQLFQSAFDGYLVGHCTGQKRISVQDCRQSEKITPFAANGDVSYVYQWWPLLDPTYPNSWGERQSIWVEVSEPVRYGVTDDRREKWMYRLERLNPKKSVIGGEVMLRNTPVTAIYKYKMHPGNRLGPELKVMNSRFEWIRHNNAGLKELVEKLKLAGSGY
ncbi:MAG: hypothetical protein Alpg2KO_18270 [Alphaproteobacteria bacterium]